MKVPIVAIALALGCTGSARTTGPAVHDTLPAVPVGSEALSLGGEPLAPPVIGDAELAKRQAAYNEARLAHERSPDDVEAAIWHGRRLGYLNRFRDAVGVFTAAIATHPNEARLYRHRGHRYITLRLFDRAIADLEKAAALRAGEPDEIEPDGQPNAANIPTSTLHGNIWYHLGLALYLRGDFAAARTAYDRCMAVATNDDSRVAAAYWQYLIRRRLDQSSDAAAVLAALPAKPEILENHAYHVLLRLYRGDLEVTALATDSDLDRHTVGYGLAMSKLFGGDRTAAIDELRRVIAGGMWPAFGYIAAEAELVRVK